MGKDPAFLFYPGDWLGGTMLMSRHHRGAYMDLLMAQFNNGHMTIQQIKTILGKVDENLWEGVLKAKFKLDEKGLFYNEKLEIEIIKRRRYTNSRRINLQKQKAQTIPYLQAHMMNHMENGNGNENENKNLDFVDQIIVEFVKAHGNYEVLNRGKEREMAGKLLAIFKKKFPTANSEETLEVFSSYFKACVNINNEWLRNNMSLTTIVNRYNEINSTLKNEKIRTGGTTDTELATIIAKHFSVNN